jgi:oxygen-independent coproporphyrinogen-3 oxidase
MKTMRKFDETTLPNPDVKLQIFQYTIDFFEGHGYKMVGMDHFAKPQDELFLAIDKGELHRNFQGYTTKGGADLIGIGLTSIGEGKLHYVQNQKEMHAYESAIDAGRLPTERGVKLTADDLVRQAVIMELMSNFKLNIPRIEKEFGIDFFDYFKEAIKELQPLQEESLIMINNNTLTASPTGAMLIRNIAMAFDAYLHKFKDNKKTFSKTI